MDNKDKLIDNMSLNDYFKAHPEEEHEFIDEMARLHYHDEPVEIPEEWPTHEWLEYA